MLFAITSFASAILIAFFLGVSVFIERRAFRIFDTKKIALSAIFVALSIILTIFGRYINFFGQQIQMGVFILFLVGIICGPTIGIVSAIASDGIAFALGGTGAYHLAFMLLKVIYAFAGACVFMWKDQKGWLFRTIIYFGIALALHLLVITPLTLSLTMGSGMLSLAMYIPRFIKYPILYTGYILLIIPAFKVMFLLMKNDYYKASKPWFLRIWNFEYDEEILKQNIELEKEEQVNWYKRSLIKFKKWIEPNRIYRRTKLLFMRKK